MFAIGLAPPRVPRRQLQRTKHEDLPDTYQRFTGLNRPWLLIPSTNYFQRALLNNSQTMSEAYLAHTSFRELFPSTSIQYALACGAFPTYLKYDEIDASIHFAYNLNMRIRTAMKMLLNAWKMKKMRIVNELDVVTQEIPKKPVHIRCWATKTIYQYECATMLQDSVNRLLIHDYLILEPNMPRNPYTNMNLGYAGCLSLHEQFRKWGVTHWVWEAFAKCEFDIYHLSKVFEVPMKIECLDLLMKDIDSPFTIDFVMDFIIGEYNYHGVLAPSESSVLQGISYRPIGNVVQQWIDLCKNYWKAQIYFDDREIASIHAKTRRLLSRKHEFECHLIVFVDLTH